MSCHENNEGCFFFFLNTRNFTKLKIIFLRGNFIVSEVVCKQRIIIHGTGSLGFIVRKFFWYHARYAWRRKEKKNDTEISFVLEGIDAIIYVDSDLKERKIRTSYDQFYGLLNVYTWCALAARSTTIENCLLSIVRNEGETFFHFAQRILFCF